MAARLLNLKQSAPPQSSHEIKSGAPEQVKYVFFLLPRILIGTATGPSAYITTDVWYKPTNLDSKIAKIAKDHVHVPLAGHLSHNTSSIAVLLAHNLLELWESNEQKIVNLYAIELTQCFQDDRLQKTGPISVMQIRDEEYTGNEMHLLGHSKERRRRCSMGFHCWAL